MNMQPPKKGISPRKGTDRVAAEEGLSLLPDNHWGIEENSGLIWQFGPNSHLEYGFKNSSLMDTSSLSLEEFACTKKSDCGEPLGFKFEWQWVMDEGYTNYGCCRLKSVDSSKDVSSGIATTRAMVIGEKDMPSKMLDSNKESHESSMALNSQAEQPMNRSGNLAAEKLSALKLPLRDGSSSWWTADSNELAALVSQKSHEDMGNCDLPRSMCSVSGKGSLPLSSRISRSDVSPNMMNKPLSGSAASPEPMYMSDPIPLKKHLSNVSGTVAIQSASPQLPKSHQNISENRQDDWRGMCGKSSHATGREVLGEALCHSQTRARKAEKLVHQVLQEKEKLALLLFREAWTSRTYKHWIEILEMEIMWLKLQVKGELDSSPLTFEHVPHGQWKYLNKRSPWNTMPSQGKFYKHKWLSGGNFLVRYTVGFAFALGLTFASAGLMIGWSMGWILLAY